MEAMMELAIFAPFRSSYREMEKNSSPMQLALWSVRWHWQAEDISIQILSAEACKYYITLSFSSDTR